MENEEDIENTVEYTSDDIIKSMIDGVEAGKNSEAADDFSTLIQDKVASALDARKIELAQNLYNRNNHEQEIDTVSEPDQGNESGT